MCSAAPQTLSGNLRGATAGDEDQGRTSEEEDGGADSSSDRQVGSDRSTCERFFFLGFRGILKLLLKFFLTGLSG